MIKTSIIIILVLLLVITLYSYYCLSSRMINFERARLEYILQKETAVKIKESEVKVIADCSNKNLQYQMALENINKILGGVNIGTINSADVINEKNDDIIKGIQNVITGKIDPNIVAEPENIQSCISKHNDQNIQNKQNINNNDLSSLIDRETINVEILSDVPSEYIQ